MLAAGVLLVSAGCGGSRTEVVPEIRGKPQKEAFRLLSTRHLCPEPMAAEWPGAAKAPLGSVVDQDPTAGARVDRGTPIRVWVRQDLAGPARTGQITLVTDVVGFC